VHAFAAGNLDDPNAAPKADLTRVDIQVLDERERPLTGLTLADFSVTVSDKIQQASGFSPVTTPIDVLFVLDVSSPMKRYVDEFRAYATEAMRALGEQDRVAVMVFDMNARPALPFTSGRTEINEGLARIVRLEPFLGGAQITSSLISAAAYLQRHARPEARHAIVVLTGNTTQDSTDEDRVLRALQKADATLSFLFPNEKKDVDEDGDPLKPSEKEIRARQRREANHEEAQEGRHRPPPSPYQSAGVDAIARDAGGDNVVLEDEYILEEAFLHLRRKYTLHLVGSTDNLFIDLSRDARARFPSAILRYRVLFQVNGGVESVVAPIGLLPPGDNTGKPVKRKMTNEQPN
jgi:VWFA-related protein